LDAQSKKYGGIYDNMCPVSQRDRLLGGVLYHNQISPVPFGEEEDFLNEDIFLADGQQ
jgi:hypothetical protein